MSVYIRGMEMPKSCAECPVNLYFCHHGYKYLLEHMELYDRRADECPIIEVPPHGRLVDADVLAEEHRVRAYQGNVSSYSFHTAARAWVDDAPTVIPADKEVDNDN